MSCVAIAQPKGLEKIRRAEQQTQTEAARAEAAEAVAAEAVAEVMELRKQLAAAERQAAADADALATAAAERRVARSQAQIERGRVWRLTEELGVLRGGGGGSGGGA